MYQKDLHKVWLATGEKRVYLEPSMANRHGLIAGAAGTGKTVTLFSALFSLLILPSQAINMGAPLSFSQ